MGEKSRFDFIGKTYEYAISAYPNARTDQFWLLKNLSLKEEEKALEITAGTGFLTKMLSAILKNGLVVAQDISPVMIQFNRDKHKGKKNIKFYIETDIEYPKLKNNFFDKSVCLGGFHHIENQAGVVGTIYKKLKKGGVFCVGDFADCSRIQRYFDERINNLTLTGHKGLFLSPSHMVNFARIAGFSDCVVEKKVVYFHFSTKKDIGIFFSKVHGLNQKPDDTIQDIKKYLGIKKGPKGFAVPIDYVYAKYTK